MLYAYLATPVYQTQVVLRPAYMQSLDKLNSTGLYTLEPATVLSQVGAELESYSNRWAFFQAHQALFEGLSRGGRTLEQRFGAFNGKAFTALAPGKKEEASRQGSYVGLRLEYPEGVDGVAILNGLVETVLKQEQGRVAGELSVLIDNRLAQLARQIEAAKAEHGVQVAAEVARLHEDDQVHRRVLEDELAALRLELRTRRENRLQELDEAIRIATALGIDKPTTPSALSQDGSRGSGGSVIRTEINNQQIPLYFMGVRALRAERDVLTTRESDDFLEPRVAAIAKELLLLQHNRRAEALRERGESELFVENIAQMQGEQARLASLRLDVSNVQLVRLDQPAVQPLDPVRPRKGLIIALGAALGLISGLLIALMRAAADRRGRPA